MTGFSSFGNNNNLEKSNLSNSNNKNNKVVMPPKLNLNINLNEKNLINSIEDTSNSKSSFRSPSTSKDVGPLSSNDDNIKKSKNALALQPSNQSQTATNKQGNFQMKNLDKMDKISSPNLSEPKNSLELIKAKTPVKSTDNIVAVHKIEQNIAEETEEKDAQNEGEDEENNEGNNEGNNDDLDYEEDEDYDNDYIDYIPLNKNTSSQKSQISPIPQNKIKIPKLTISLQKNQLSDEKLTDRVKKITEDEETFSQLPESTLVTASNKIISSMMMKGKLAVPGLKLGGKDLGWREGNGSGEKRGESDGREEVGNGEKKDGERAEKEEKIDIKALNEDYSLKDWERKQIINDYYSRHLSEIIPNFLYLSSYNAAKNKELLIQNKITHVINCAADFCENVYSKELKYLAFYLKDHVMENIECVFYESIEFIENVKKSNGRVLVHCIQGMSRSVSIVIAYLIYKEKMTYDKAFDFVQKRREISSPNFGFSIQLQNFYMRLYQPPEKYRYIPKIYAVGSFQNEQRNKIVCRLINEPFYENKDTGLPRMLDKRGVFIVVNINKCYIWVGSKIISEEIKELYVKTAKNYLVNYVIKYENIKLEGEVKTINEGKETEEFLRDLLKTDEKFHRFKNKISDVFTEWNNWYKDIDLNSLCSESVDNGSSGQKEEQNVVETKKSFFMYPNETPEAVLDFDDLSDDQFLVACFYEESKRKIYVWKGKSNEIGKKAAEDFVEKVSARFFGQFNLGEGDVRKIERVNEVPMEESDEFLNLI